MAGALVAGSCFLHCLPTFCGQQMEKGASSPVFNRRKCSVFVRLHAAPYEIFSVLPKSVQIPRFCFPDGRNDGHSLH